MQSLPLVLQSNCCRILAVILAITLAVLLVVVLILRPPEPPVDYSKIPLISDWDWDLIADTNAGWFYLKRTASKDSTIIQDMRAPVSKTNVLNIDFNGTRQDTEPGVWYHTMPGAREAYVEWWMKVSDNFKCSPAGCAKLHFFFPNKYDLYTGLYCDNPPNGSCSSPDIKELVIGGQLQWPPYGGNPISPNMEKTVLTRGQWYKIASYFKYPETGNNGIWRIYVDDKLNLELTDVTIPSDMTGMIEFQFAPTLQNPDDGNNMTIEIDHTILRAQ